MKFILFLSAIILLTTAWLYKEISDPYSRIGTILSSFKVIYYMTEEDVNRFMKSYVLFQTEKVNNQTEKLIVDYYNVLNFLCSLGDVEKMYIPPVIDESKGIFDNQILYEKRMMKYLDAGKDKRILDVGCGRGSVSAHIAKETGANLTGINIDPAQLKVAREQAERKNLDNRLTYLQSSFNDKFPFEDESFDGLYDIQALSYAFNLEDVFKEMYRVLKPGGKLSFLEWFRYDFDYNNPEHVELLRKCKAIIAAVYTPTTEEMVTLLEKVGFKVIVNENASINGHQYSLIEKADFYFTTMHSIVRFLVKIRVLPNHFLVLFDRLTKDADSFIVGDKQRLWTSCHQIVAEKPQKKY